MAKPRHPFNSFSHKNQKYYTFCTTCLSNERLINNPPTWGAEGGFLFIPQRGEMLRQFVLGRIVLRLPDGSAL